MICDIYDTILNVFLSRCDRDRSKKHSVKGHQDTALETPRFYAYQMTLISKALGV